MTSANIIFHSIVGRRQHVANFLCLLTKQFIYKQRCLNQSIHFTILKEHWSNIENVEKYIDLAIKNDMLVKHERKWCHGSQNSSSSQTLDNFISHYILEM